MATQISNDNVCCLVYNGIRCSTPVVPSNACYTKRLQNIVSCHNLDFTRETCVGHFNICDFHKNFIMSFQADNSANKEEQPPQLDLNVLQLNTLRRYKRFFNIPTKSSANKAQLAEVLGNHFKTIPINEKEILSFFIYTIKTNSNKLDKKLNPETENSSLD